MFRVSVFKCPHLTGSNDGARCDAALYIAENNLIKHMEGTDIKLCLNKKRRFEACYIYCSNLRRIAISRLSVRFLLPDSRPHAFSSL